MGVWQAFLPLDVEQREGGDTEHAVTKAGRAGSITCRQRAMKDLGAASQPQRARAGAAGQAR